jgi:hypothetical protein
MIASRISLLVPLALLAGCSSGSGLYGISGTVDVDGAPLEKGSISFQPMEQQGTSTGSPVIGGKYQVPRDTGLAPGKYRVVINAAVPGSAGKVLPADAQPGDPPPPPLERIPKEWNTESKHTIEIKPSGPFVVPFEVSTKGK